MARQKNIANLFKSPTRRGTNNSGTNGFDNSRENIDPHLRTKVLDTKEIVQDGVQYDLSAMGGGGNVDADANLTNETIIQGDGGAKKIKTSTATVTNITDNTSHRLDVTTNPHNVLLNQLGNPDGDKTFNMVSRQLKFNFSNPSGNPVEFQASGGYTGSLVHIHQHTGNPGATYLLEVEASDTDVEHIKTTGALATTHALCLYVTGDASERFQIQSDGKMDWGDGTGARDTNLYRSAANSLKTDDALEVVGNITTSGTVDGRDIAADGTTLDDIPVSNLANGTDGELITWDAAGAPAVVAVGTVDHVLTSNGVGAAPTFQAVAGGGSGDAEISLLKPESVIQGTWVVGNNASFMNFREIRNTSSNDADSCTFKQWMAAGTYTLYMLSWNTGSGGILDIYIDASEEASFDLYTGANANVINEQTAITVATSGLKTITLTVDGKNGSSSSYEVRPQKLCFVRTA